MENKKIVTCIYLENGKAVRGLKDRTVISEDPIGLALSYSNFGADEMIVFDFSTDDDSHEKALCIIKHINRMVDIPMIGAGNVKRLEDVKKLIYAGCKKAALNLKKEENIELAEEVCKRFGRDKIVGCAGTVEELKNNDVVVKNFMSEVLLIEESVLDECLDWVKQSNIGVANPVYVEILPVLDNKAMHESAALLRQFEQISGIAGGVLNEKPDDIMTFKQQCKGLSIPVNTFESSLKFSDFKLNSDGMLPVVVQDYKTGEVLMVAYMDEIAYQKTVETGIMTYFSRSRKELWVKGATSGHYQYVKALYADCDQDTLLAKVLQIGAACHTGNRSCFYQQLMKKDYNDTNPLMVFEKEYKTILDRKQHPKEGSYTNYLFDKGIDKILKKVGEECTEIIIAAKNPNPEEIKYEIADFLYHAMVLMAEKDVTWDDITKEIAQR